MLENFKMRSRREIDPKRDWIILCVLFVLMTVAMFSIALYIFYSASSLSMSSGSSVSSTLDQARLSKVLTDWRAKEIKFNQTLESKQSPVDPSL